MHPGMQAAVLLVYCRWHHELPVGQQLWASWLTHHLQLVLLCAGAFQLSLQVRVQVQAAAVLLVCSLRRQLAAGQQLWLSYLIHLLLQVLLCAGACQV